MKAIMLYRPKGEHATSVEQYMRDFEKQTGHKIEPMDYDTVEGQEFARNRSIITHPALVVVDGDTAIVRQWLGASLPLKDDVLAYLVSNA